MTKMLMATVSTVAALALLVILLRTPAESQVQGVLPGFVRIQSSTPGTPQTGHSNITGTIVAGQFQGGGAALTNVNAVTLSGLPPGAFGILGLGNNWTGTNTFSNAANSFVGSGAGLTGLNASNVSTGTLAAARLPIPMQLSGAASLGIIVATNTSGTAQNGIVGEIFGGSGLAQGLYGLNNRTNGNGVLGFMSSLTGATNGVQGRSDSSSGTGVWGQALNSSGSTKGVYGYAVSPAGTGVLGEVTTSGNGVYGIAPSGIGVSGNSANETGVAGVGGKYGVTAFATTTNGIGLAAQAGGTNARAIDAYAYATSGTTFGVRSRNASSEGAAVYGLAESTASVASGVWGVSLSQSTASAAVKGEAVAGAGVNGTATTGTGVLGTSGTSGLAGSFIGGRAIYARATASNQQAITAIATGSYGVWSTSTSSTGVLGESSTGVGVWGQSGSSNGLVGISDTNDGIVGQTKVSGKSSVFGYTNTTGANGGYFNSASNTGYGNGVVAQCVNTGGYAVLSMGNFGCTALKLFVIDHPLDPERRLLQHYCAEGPEPMNSYSGSVVTGSDGRVWVNLPSYFEAANRNPRVQLTVEDESNDFVMVKVSRPVQAGKFQIATSKPGTKVYWKVDAVRNDPAARSQTIQAERDKPTAWQGRYLSPELYGMPPERGVYADRTGSQAIGGRP